MSAIQEIMRQSSDTMKQGISTAIKALDSDDIVITRIDVQYWEGIRQGTITISFKEKE